MTAAARRTRRTGAKTDQIDALEIARIAARDDDLPAPRCSAGTADMACASIVHEFLCGGWFCGCGLSFCDFWGCGVIFRVVVWMGRGVCLVRGVWVGVVLWCG